MMTSNDTVTVLLCGVGGQGTILAADLLAHAALESPPWRQDASSRCRRSMAWPSVAAP